VEAAMLFDMMFGGIILLGGFILRRIFSLTDSLAAEDRKLHGRITIVQTEYVSKKDFDTAVDRIIDCINRLEAKIK
jgi:hypothetical protein|tara:strand:+ start:324 stop:551 length:228 start_codon:yes stop_codon:yes gene_type:complete